MQGFGEGRGGHTDFGILSEVVWKEGDCLVLEITRAFSILLFPSSSPVIPLPATENE